MTNWKTIENAPKDGRPVLLWARFKTQPAEKEVQSYPVVGFWHKSIGRWKVFPEDLNRGEELIPTYWVELPKAPNVSD
jgi:hypothetical protein